MCPARPPVMNIATTASPRPYPSADASNVLHLPESERADIWQMLIVVVSRSMRFTPATTPFRNPSPRMAPVA